MADMFAYIDWRGDIRFRDLSPNPVDALIFSALSYIDFSKIVPQSPWQWIRLEDAALKLLALPDPLARTRVKNDLELLKAAAGCPRFSQVGLSFYRAELIPEEETQFSAITYYLDDGTAFLTYRGTDSTMVGWKEDFNMSFSKTVPAQHKALQYLNEFASIGDSPLRLCGHSKGGNLAVYAGSKCEPAVQSRILEIHNQDGPGFTEYMMGDPGYLRMVPKIKTFIPESSVIGMLLEHEEPYTVVKSRQIGILQHEPYSWEIMGGSFILTEQVTADSRFLDKTIKEWLSGMDIQERNELVDTVFDVIAAGDVNQTNELIHPKNIKSYIRNLSENPEARALIAGEIGNLFRAAAKLLEKTRIEHKDSSERKES